MQLHDSVVLLTGATGGMGQAFVAELVHAGAQVVVVGRDALQLEKLVQSGSSRVTALQADLRSRADRQRIVSVMRTMSGFNVLINAAGINNFAFFEGQSDEEIEDQINVNLTANLLMTRDLLPLLRRAPAASVVNIGSTFGAIGYPGYVVYSATKFALRGFSEALRRELADSRVRVLYLAPRATRTAMNTASAEQLNAALGVASDSPQQVAQHLMRALQNDLKELHLGFPERLLVRLNCVWPGLISHFLRKKLPVIREHAAKQEASV